MCKPLRRNNQNTAMTAYLKESVPFSFSQLQISGCRFRKLNYVTDVFDSDRRHALLASDILKLMLKLVKTVVQVVELGNTISSLQYFGIIVTCIFIAYI